MTDTSSSPDPDSGQHLRAGASADTDLKYRALLAQLQDPHLRFPACPAFVEDLDVFEMPDGLGIQFRGAESPVILRGRSVVPVLQYLRERLDGNTEVESLLRSRPPEISPALLLRSLLLLQAKGLLVSGLSVRDAGPERQSVPED